MRSRLALLPALLAFALPCGAVALEQTPETAEVAAQSSLSGSFLAGQSAALNNDDQAAIAFYRRSIELDPKDAELRRSLFLSLLADGKVAEAVEVMRTLEGANADDGLMRLVGAVDAMKRRSWPQVGELLKNGSSRDLDRMVDQLMVAWSQYGAGDKAAVQATLAAIEGPDWVGAVRDYHAGLIAAADGDDAAAIASLQRAVDNQAMAAVLQESWLRALEALVRAHARAGDKAGAERALALGLERLPSHPPFRALRAALDKGEPLEPLITQAPRGAAEVLYDVGSAVNRQGGSSFAQGYLQLAGYLAPDSNTIAMALGEIYSGLKRFEISNEMYGRVAEGSPYRARARIEMALNLDDLDKVDEAVAALREVLAADPANDYAATVLGSILSKRERFAEAAAVYDDAIARVASPQRQHWLLFYRRGIAHERTKQWPKAEADFKRALELFPDQPDVLNYLGYSWIDQGINLDEGMALIRKAVELKPDSGAIVDSLGWAHYKLGQYDEAVEQLEKALDLMPGDPTLNDHLGDAYWKVGRRLEAVFQWNHALDSKPDPALQPILRRKIIEGLKDEPAAPAAASGGTEPATRAQ